MSVLPSAVAQWPEPPRPGTSLQLFRIGWKYDAITGAYSIVTDPTQVNTELVDVSSTGTATLQPLGTAPTAPRLTTALRGVTAIIYQG